MRRRFCDDRATPQVTMLPLLGLSRMASTGQYVEKIDYNLFTITHAGKMIRLAVSTSAVQQFRLIIRQARYLKKKASPLSTMTPLA